MKASSSVLPASFSGYAVALPELSDKASSAKAKSEADWKRCSGFFSRQRWTTRCRAGGRFVVTCEIAGGSSFRMAVIVSAKVGCVSAYLLRRHVACRAHHRSRFGALGERQCTVVRAGLRLRELG